MITKVVALVALFVSLGGGVYAASKINGKQLKKSSVAGNRLKADTVTDKQVNESSLGQVRNATEADHAKTADRATSAASADRAARADSAATADRATTADSATTATTATTLAGAGPASFVSSNNILRREFDVTPADNAFTTATLFQLGSFNIEATCSAGTESIVLRASSTGADASLDAGWVRGTAADSNGVPLATAPTTVAQFTSIGTTSRIVGTMVYNDSTSTITIPFAVIVSDFGAAGTRCFFSGTATRVSG